VGAKTKFRRIQELFDLGEVIEIEDPKGGPITVWVSKLNSFEHEEAMRDARAHRARQVIAFDRDPDQKIALDEVVRSTSDAEIIQVLMYDREMEHLRLARNEVRTDKAWQERLEALDRADLDGATDAQAAALEEVSREFDAAVHKIRARLAIEYNDELQGSTREELEKLYVEQFRNMTGVHAFREGMRQTELFFALRDCSAVSDGDGWVHKGCDHSVRLLDSRADVTSLPDAVLNEAVEVLNRQMSDDEAGNSGAPSVSSGPSGQRAVQEASVPSSPVEM